MVAELVQNKYLLKVDRYPVYPGKWGYNFCHFCLCIFKIVRDTAPFHGNSPHPVGVGCDGREGRRDGPHNSIQPRAPKNFNPALIMSEISHSGIRNKV